MKKIGIYILVLLLCACSSYNFNSGMVDPETYVNKQMVLSNDKLLAETKHWNPSNGERYWLFPIPEQSYKSNYIKRRIPTLAEYHQQAANYHLWKGSTLDGWSRIIAIVPKGTRYHIIDIAPKMQGGHWTIIEIDEGPYQYRSAILF